MTSLSHETPVLPPTDSQKLAQVRDMLEATGSALRLRDESGKEVGIPQELYEVLVSAVDGLMAGKAITVAPVNVTLTTQEAADFLGISRPSVVKLLNEARIPYERPAAGRHRRIQLSDLIDYQERQRVAQREALDTMVRMDQIEGIYDDELPSNYLEIIRTVRKNLHK